MLPPRATQFHVFDLESDVCDTIRCEYRVGERLLHLAQSRYVICIQLTSKEFDTIPPLPEVARVASEIIRDAESVMFTQHGTFNGGPYGHRVPEAAIGSSNGFPNWQLDLRWWYQERKLNFVTIKSAGGPTREVIAGDLPTNVHWFPASSR